MDESMIKIGAMDVDVYSSHAGGYRAPQFLDEYGPSPSSSYGFNSFPNQLHATETRFIMESLDAAAPRHGYPELQFQANKSSVMQQFPPPSVSLPRAVSAPASVSGSHRSSDSDVEDGDDADLDTSALSKEELRKHKNRQSAARSRKRSRDRMGQLEALVRQLSAKNRQLEEQVQALLLERAAVERHAHIPQQPPHHPFQASHHAMHTQYY